MLDIDENIFDKNTVLLIFMTQKIFICNLFVNIDDYYISRIRQKTSYS